MSETKVLNIVSVIYITNILSNLRYRRYGILYKCINGSDIADLIT